MTAEKNAEVVQEETPAAPPTLTQKLASVMSEIGHIPKRGRNDFHGYDYATEADLVDAVREKLAVRNVMLIPSLDSTAERAAKTPKGKDTTITSAHMQFTFVDGDSGEQLVAKWAGCGEDPSDKGLYKAYTGAIKYFLMKTFLIPTGDDPERDNAALTGRDTAAARGDAATDGQPSRPVSADPVAAVLANVSDAKRAGAGAMLRGFNVSRHEDLDDDQREQFVAWLQK